MTDTNLDKLERDVAHARGRFADDLALETHSYPFFSQLGIINRSLSWSYRPRMSSRRSDRSWSSFDSIPARGDRSLPWSKLKEDA